jgi:phosphorylcholine metabolism protein LicD
MEWSTDFFRDEVRCGFYIPTAIKQAWAAGLTVLAEIDRICTKYDITYFADWGSLLGAVRHGGFVPWDDDLDICMKREDYVKFRQVADKELPQTYAIHDYERQDNHWLFLARVVNNNEISFDIEHLEQFHNYPYMASVDIFLLDYLYRDEEKEKERCDEVKHILAVADSVKGEVDSAKEWQLRQLEEKYGVQLPRKRGERELKVALYRLAEQQMSRVPKEEADNIGQIFPWVLKGSRGTSKKYFEKTVCLPFENTTIPVSAFYDKTLKFCYGEYLTIRKQWDGHDYPYFEGQRENLQAVADFKLPEFTFDKKLLPQHTDKAEDSQTLKDMAVECMENMQLLQKEMISAGENQDYEGLLSYLPELQQLAVDLGTLIENVKGEKNPISQCVVATLEQYCDALYVVYELVANAGDHGVDLETLRNDLAGVSKAFQVVDDEIQSQLLKKKDILFLTTGAKQWEGFDSLYKEVVKDENSDVYVVPLPVLFKNPYGEIKVTDEELKAATRESDYPDYLSLTSWTQYNVALHHPDVIYIQDPYDGENPCLSIPPQYYAQNLQKYTDCLIYIPAFRVDEFDERAQCDIYNMKHYVTAPAVICSDYVYVQSENMKQRYIEKLVEFAGQETRAIWEKKILPQGLPDMDKDEPAAAKKTMLYCIGENELAEKGEAVIPFVKERLEIFREHQEDIDTKLCFYPPDVQEWKIYDKEKTEQLLALIKQYENEPWLEVCEWRINEEKKLEKKCDAYYGSPSPLVCAFSLCNKPVMQSL